MHMGIGQCTIGVLLFRYIEGYHLLELNYVFQDMAQMQSALGQDLNAHEPGQTLASPIAVTAVINVPASGRRRGFVYQINPSSTHI